VAGGHQKSYPGVISKASTTALPGQLLLDRKGHSLSPASSPYTNLELKQESHRLLAGLPNAPPTLRLSWWTGGWSGAVCSHLHSLSSSTLHSTALGDSNVKLPWNEDPMPVLPAFKDYRN